MPFPWKKAKRLGQIPQLISDLKTKRNRSSLNLQTGFPTSLADFVVKNRDRLKKSRKQTENKSDKSSDKSSDNSSPPRSDLVASTAAEAPFLDPSYVPTCSVSPVTTPQSSPLNVESGCGFEDSGRTEEDELGSTLDSSPGNRLQENRHDQLLLRLPAFKEPATLSSNRSPLEGKRGVKNKSEELRRRLPPRKEIAAVSSSSSDNGSAKNPENRRGKNRLHQAPPWVVRPYAEGADNCKPELLSPSNESSRPEKDKRGKLLRRLPARRFEVFVSSVSREIQSPRTKTVSQADDADGEVPALPIQRNLSVASMVFFVLVLALGTKKITMVMTISVMLLFLLEFGRKYIHFWCKRCAQPRTKASSPASILGYKKEDAASEKGKGLQNSFREIQTQSRSTTSELVISDSENKMILVNTQDVSVRKEGSGEEFESVNWKSEVDLVYIENVSVRKEGSGNLKAKWKKLVKKKFRPARGKKGCQDQEETSDSVSESPDCGTEKEEDDEGANEEVDDEVCSASEGTRLVDESVCVTRKWNVRHLVFFLLLLVGLVKGRIMALTLTIAWVLLIKSAEALGNKLMSFTRQGSQI
ncbi:hypothetical protein H6P81_019704 [Aristolochia fimbriata]|uniref:Uncharacterized protein n=1 Tax=Aristolochia fimbriata TaxID=158543 RepID=A0AAV7DU75_ARIFI|nr:hypothetical protein H6P81_019704 [Aristolochia fimbriata]